MGNGYTSGRRLHRHIQRRLMTVVGFGGDDRSSLCYSHQLSAGLVNLGDFRFVGTELHRACTAFGQNISQRTAVAHAHGYGIIRKRNARRRFLYSQHSRTRLSVEGTRSDLHFARSHRNQAAALHADDIFI